MLHADVDGVTVAARTAGDASKPALVLLHGWPQSSRAFEGVLSQLGADNFVLAFDLPGIGASRGAPPSACKHAIAGYDVGGMIAYAAARDHVQRISGAMVMNTVIPGIPPWEDVLADPRIFHFALHALPDLPEVLVAGKQRRYFDFFYDIMAGDKGALTEAARNEYASAYERPDALTAGFDWYRAMGDDAVHNAPRQRIGTPILYVRGDADGRSPDDYVPALRENGAAHIEGKVIPGGEYVAEEAPAQLIAAIGEFRGTLARMASG
jgi:pimeloyl-ACP methyl ester carboxylesterase